MKRSKIYEVHGVPVVIVTVGAYYPQWIERWLAANPVSPTKYHLADFASKFVGDYFAHHRPMAEKHLADNGFTLTAEPFAPGSQERLLAGAAVQIVGFEPHALRAQLWQADFPDSQIVPEHFSVVEIAGRTQRVEKATILCNGNYEPFDALLPHLDAATLTAEQAVEAVEFILGTVEKFDRWHPGPLSPRILSPFDVVRLTAEGVEWVKGSEGNTDDAAPQSPVYAAGFDSSGNLKASTAFAPTLNTIAATPGADNSNLQSATVGNRHLMSKSVQGTQVLPSVYSTSLNNVNDSNTTWDLAGASQAADAVLTDGDTYTYNTGSAADVSGTNPPVIQYYLPASSACTFIFSHLTYASGGYGIPTVFFNGTVASGTITEETNSVSGSSTCHISTNSLGVPHSENGAIVSLSVTTQ
ncbi:MAG: hypothetical protein ACYCUI_07850, partial [Vulcanimicrobiaceae bacterium]